MGEIVNLRRAKKRRAAKTAEAAASANRAAFGVSKSAKIKAQAERSLTQSRLDGHRRESRDGD
jgi:Domain of unknown function (DUF4169)